MRIVPISKPSSWLWCLPWCWPNNPSQWHSVGKRGNLFFPCEWEPGRIKSGAAGWDPQTGENLSKNEADTADSKQREGDYILICSIEGLRLATPILFNMQTPDFLFTLASLTSYPLQPKTCWITYGTRQSMGSQRVRHDWATEQQL